MNFFHHKDLGNHLLQLCPKVVKHPVFVHISDIEGEYVPLPGDEVKYKVCPIPPKYEKNQATNAQIVNLDT